MPPGLAVIVPCYNEERRLDAAGFAPLLAHPSATLVFVNDGSTDGTLGVLERLRAAHPERIEVLSLPRNQGKAGAVRAGLQQALAGGADLVGYLDADLATPAAEMLRLGEVLEARGADAALGARIALLGANIRRSPMRHYLGRVFASAASLALGIPVYDTQCGAKLFRAGPALAEALATPFQSPWSFDVELIGRLLVAGARIVEVPLTEWHDVRGSKLGMADMLRSGLDLVRIYQDLERRRRARP